MKKRMRLGLCILISSLFALSFSNIKADEEYYVVFSLDNLEYNYNRDIIEGTDIETLKTEVGLRYPKKINIGVNEFKSDGTPLKGGLAPFPVEWDFDAYDASKEKQTLAGEIHFEERLDQNSRFPFIVDGEIKWARVDQENMDEMNEKIHLTLHSIKQNSEQPVFSIYHPSADSANYPYFFSMPVLPNVNEVYSEYSIDGGKNWSESNLDGNYFFAGDNAYKSAGIYLNIPFKAEISKRFKNGEIASLQYRLKIITDTKMQYSTSVEWPLALNKIDSIEDSGGDRGDVGDTEETPSTPIEPEAMVKPEEKPMPEKPDTSFEIEEELPQEEVVDKKPLQNTEVPKPLVSLGANTNREEIAKDVFPNASLIESILPEEKQQESQIPIMEKETIPSRKNVARTIQKVQTDEGSGGFRVSPGMVITLISFLGIGGVSVTVLHVKKKRF